MTETKPGSSGRRSSSVRRSARRPSSVLGGKNSNEKHGSEGLSRFLIFIAPWQPTLVRARPVPLSLDRAPEGGVVRPRIPCHDRRLSTGFTARWVRGWSTSPAGTCRSSTPGWWRSTRRCAPPPACSTSRTWGRSSSAGEGALESANALITNDLGKCADGQAVYAGLLNHQGGFVDDVVAYRFSPEHILICVNASNREKDFAWMTENTPRVQPVNRSDDFAQLAIQGPKAAGIVQTPDRPAARVHRHLPLPRGDGGRRARASSRAPATPARTASSSTARRTGPSTSGTRCSRRGGRRAWSPRASARATRCAPR